MKIMEIGLQGWCCPGKWNPVARELGGESLGYSEQTARRTLRSPGVPQTDTIARTEQREGSRVGHGGRRKLEEGERKVRVRRNSERHAPVALLLNIVR